MREILIVEDPSEQMEAYKRMLGKEGYKVWHVTSVEDAVGLLRQGGISIALIGYGMTENLEAPALQTIKRYAGGCKLVLLTECFDCDVFVKAIHGMFHECLACSDSEFLVKEVMHDLVEH